MKTKTLSKSLFPLCALPFFSSFPVVAKQQGNIFSLVLPVVPEAGREKGTQWRHCGVNVPPPGCGCRAASCGPDDCAPWWSAGRDATCHVGMWVEHAALQLQSRASLKHKAEPTSSPGDTVLCVLCVCVCTAQTLTLTKVLKIHFQGALTGADGRPHRNPQRGHKKRHWNGSLLSSIMFCVTDTL